MTYNEVINNPGYFALLVPTSHCSGKFTVAAKMAFVEFEKLPLSDLLDVACELLVRGGFQTDNRRSEEAVQLVQRGSSRVSYQSNNIRTDCYLVNLIDDSCISNIWDICVGVRVEQKFARSSLNLETSASKSLKDVINSLNSACFTQNFTTNCCGVKFFNNTFQNISLSGGGTTLVGFKAPKGHTASGRGDFSESNFKSTTTHRVFKDGKYLRKFKKGSTLTQTSGGRVHTLVAETCHKRYSVGSRHYYFILLDHLKVSN